MPGEAVLALPEKQADARGADRLRGIEIGGQIFLPGAQRNASLRAGRHIGEPCPGPADGDHRAPAVGSLDVEKREGVLRRASALGSHIERIAGSQHFRPLMEIGFRHMAAIGIMYGETALAGRRQVQIDDLDLLDRRRIGIRQVLEVQHPFDRSENRRTLSRGIRPSGRCGGPDTSTDTRARPVRSSRPAEPCTSTCAAVRREGLPS